MAKDLAEDADIAQELTSAPAPQTVVPDPIDVTPTTIPTSTPTPTIDSAPLVPQANILAVSTEVPPPNNDDTLSASIDDLFADVGGNIGGEVDGPPPASQT
ncbi:unnamed protein product [Ilex paraguariensis]|uniref:Uncharacterized protein n=1 Tax=Ilex paraguariensis TaxID=185542 RepID=A0ABC8R248_9AQUA